MITMKNLLESKGGMGDIYGPRSSPPHGREDVRESLVDNVRIRYGRRYSMTTDPQP